MGMLLDHIDRYDLGHALRLALLDRIANRVSTADVGGTLGTRAFTEAVVKGLVERLPA